MMEGSDTEGLIENIHERLPTPSSFDPDKEEIVLVKGKYLFCHFNQQGTNDSGWGCAYRSMQTLCSWFILNESLHNYKAFKERGNRLPSHKDIQSTLVAIQDKPPSFLNSREWIGSYELCLCFDELYQVPCKILNVRSGREVESKGPELVEHFKAMGTPVMIGGTTGGAVTLLGVRCDKGTGRVREWLLLDPHYTGSDEDLNKILQEGWIAWHTSSHFSPSMFYNFCLPIIKKYK